jgi:hypothetical protein
LGSAVQRQKHKITKKTIAEFPLLQKASPRKNANQRANVAMGE